jgi:hypothetical protein
MEKRKGGTDGRREEKTHAEKGTLLGFLRAFQLTEGERENTLTIPEHAI